MSNFLHAGSIGDVWAALPALREFHRKTGKKATLYLQKDVESYYYEGATHPTRAENGEMCLLNSKMIGMMLPLLKAQPYIEDAKEWNGEPINIDLNKIRETNVGMPYLDLRRWYFYVFPDLAGNLSERYIFIPPAEKDFASGKIIVSRTERYLNPTLDYSFLKNYDCIFSGTEGELEIFNAQFGLNLERLKIDNFLELAQALTQCKFLLSNQTQIFQIAQGIKIPRVVEVHPMVPNVIVTEENAYDFLSQTGLEYYVNYLNGRP